VTSVDPRCLHATSPAPVRTLLLLARGIGFVAISVLAITALTPLPNIVAHRLTSSDQAMTADAIVPLAATILVDGTLSDNSLRRLVRAVDLYAQGLAPLLVVSGVNFGNGQNEAEARAALASRFGVPPSAILTVTGHHTTGEEALAVVAALRPRGARRLLVVTDWAHAQRAREIFERTGIDVRVTITQRPPEIANTAESRLRLAWDCFRELFARVYYRLVGFV
jgi:uncharacterized SAM-binding protein YcdF (DUF218 family)